MKLGSKSLLFGAHQFLVHPFFVALAWVKLYSWPKDWRLWVAFVVHDWGYWGCNDMDGPEGANHPRLGACIMTRLFDRKGSIFWWRFMACHSRSYAAKVGQIPSRLCYADKIATVLTPNWLWVFSCWLTGELDYFRASPDVRLHNPELSAFEWIETAKQDTRNWFKKQNWPLPSAAWIRSL